MTSNQNLCDYFVSEFFLKSKAAISETCFRTNFPFAIRNEKRKEILKMVA